MNTFYVTLQAEYVVKMLYDAVIGGSVSGELKDEYTITTPQNGVCTVLIFEKYYGRVGNRLTLTVVIDNFSGNTRVHYTSGGGGSSFLFSFDWGASDSFASIVPNTLSPFIIK